MIQITELYFILMMRWFENCGYDEMREIQRERGREKREGEERDLEREREMRM